MVNRSWQSRLASFMAALLFVIAAGGTADVYGSGLHDEWTALLATHVDNGRVDYLGFKQDEALLDGYLEKLAAADPGLYSDAEQLAYYINGYNAYTVKLILDNFKSGKPVSSIKKIGGLFSSPWSIEFAVLGGESLTLDNIEHDIIRPRFGDPRVHFAINCASKGCPPLMNQAYAGDMLEQQLDYSTSAFLNNPSNSSFSGNTLYVSKIFKWFSEDFNGDVTGFVTRYAQGELLDFITTTEGSLQIKFLDYDWSLNM